MKLPSEAILNSEQWTEEKQQKSSIYALWFEGTCSLSDRKLTI